MIWSGADEPGRSTPMTFPYSYKKRVLIVEDSPTQAFQTRALLVANGLQVTVAYDGADGVSQAQQLLPDMIILDLELPVKDGIEVARELKSDDTTRNIPIIMFTKLDTSEAMAKGMEVGITDYIPKDAFSKIVLIETLKQMGIIQ
jgi:PleD family two-component response regulator